MLSYATLLLGAFTLTNALAIVPRDTSCCPNGTYTSDLHLACHNNGDFSFGDGQCYQSGGANWQIQCDNTYNSADIINSASLDTRGTGEIWYYDTCFSFCESNAPGFTSINIQPGEGGACQCLKLASNSINYKGNTFSASTLAQCPVNECCEPYSGDLTTACTQDAANAQGKCVTVENNPFIINCHAVPYSWASSSSSKNTTDLNSCLQYCETTGIERYWNAVVYDNTTQHTCSCATTESSFASGPTLQISSLFETPFQICGN